MESVVTKRSHRGFVDKLPLEVIGDILSRVGVARDVIRASLTCKKWREAFRKHLHTLSFDVLDDDPVYSELPTADLEVLITKTLFQTTGLRKLSILMNDKHMFSAGSVVAWLLFVRDTLLELCYKVRTSCGIKSINVLDICGRQKLETLSLFDYTVNDVEPNFQRFPCLTSLSLCRVLISVEDLNPLLLVFPKLERLELSKPILWTVDDTVDSHDMTIKLHCPTFKSLILNDLEQMEFILEDGCIESVDVNHCYFGSFKVTGSNRLRHFKFLKSEAHYLDFDEGGNLEVLEFIACHVLHSNLFPMEIHAPKLKTFRVWGFRETPLLGFDIEEEAFVDRPFTTVDFDQIAACSPQLRHLAMFCEDGGDFNYKFGELSSLENVVFLELGWEILNGFWEWAENALRRCPNVRKLVLHGICQEDVFLEHFAKFTTSMAEMVKKYPHIEVQILYSPLCFDATQICFNGNPLTKRWSESLICEFCAKYAKTYVFPNIGPREGQGL